MALRTIYPCYFDASLTRKEGRRVAKSEAVPQPNLNRLVRAAKAAGLAVAEEDASASHPARWFAKEGRLVIEYAGSKEELLHKIAAALWNMYDFHCHTTYSDGELIPSELIRRMAYTGYTEMGIADHADFSNIEELIAAQKRVKRSAEQYGIRLFTGVELTHVPPKEIDELAHLAKSLGAEIVIVHGETTAEPVAEGTNHAALSSEAVDILAHPGLITEADAKLAAENNIFLEVTARGGHNRTNGHIVTLGRQAGASFVIQSDIHSPDDIINERLRYLVARGAGMTEGEAKTALSHTAEDILNR